MRDDQSDVRLSLKQAERSLADRCRPMQAAWLLVDTQPDEQRRPEA